MLQKRLFSLRRIQLAESTVKVLDVFYTFVSTTWNPVNTYGLYHGTGISTNQKIRAYSYFVILQFVLFSKSNNCK
jgi:hypothetical protein